MSVLMLAAVQPGAASTSTTRSGRISRRPQVHRAGLDDEEDAVHAGEDEEEDSQDGDEWRPNEVELLSNDEAADPVDDVDDELADTATARTPRTSALPQDDDAERPFQCEHPGCGKAFKKRNKLNRHVQSHSNERKYICQHPGCDKKFLRAQHLAAHQQTHSGSSSSNGFGLEKTFVCTHSSKDGTMTCGQRFWTQQKLDRHVSTVHEVCPPGETITDALLGEVDHQPGPRSAEEAAGAKGKQKLYPCEYSSCDVVFRKRKHLRAHIWDVHSDAPHLSPYASTSSKSNDKGAVDGVASQRSEFEDERGKDEIRARPFPCSWPGCTLRFASNSARRTHELRHEDKKGKVYTCALPHPSSSQDQADDATAANSGSGGNILTFATWSLLRNHMREAHPPRCPRPECAEPDGSGGRIFKSADGLKAHLKRHEEQDALLQAEEQEAAELAELDDGDEMGGEGTRASAGAPTNDASTYGDPAKTGYRFECGHVDPQSQRPCLKRFKTARARDVHLRVIHQGERRFACGRCGRRFGYKCAKDKHESLAKCSPARAVESSSAAGEAEADANVEGEEEGEMDDDYFREEGGAVPERDAERAPVPASALPAVGSTSTSTAAAGATLASDWVQAAAQALARAEQGAAPSSSRPVRTRGVPAYRSSSQGEAGGKESNASRLWELFTGEGYAPGSQGDGSLPSQEVASNTTTTKRPRAADGGAAERSGEDLAAPDLPPLSKRRKVRGRIYACPWRRIVELQRVAKAEGQSDPQQAPEQEQSQEQEHDQEAADHTPSTLPECPFRFSRMYDIKRHVQARHGVDLSSLDKAALEMVMQPASG